MKARWVWIGVGMLVVGTASGAAQELPEVAVERSQALCGTDPQLPVIMREVHRAIQEHRLHTTGTVQAVVSGTLNADVGTSRCWRIVMIWSSGYSLWAAVHHGKGL